MSGTNTPLTTPVTPGGAFDYQLSAACSGLTQGCIGATTVDVLPPGIDFVGFDPSPLYTVTFDAAQPDGDGHLHQRAALAAQPGRLGRNASRLDPGSGAARDLGPGHDRPEWVDDHEHRHRHRQQRRPVH